MVICCFIVIVALSLTISKLARVLFHSKQDIAFSSLPLLELQWNKLLYSDNLLQQYNLNLNFSDLPPNQYSASFQLIKKTSMTLDFFIKNTCPFVQLNVY